MAGRDGWDVARQVANVAGAIFQVGVTAYVSAKIQDVVDEGPRSPVAPAPYAFTIWSPIFALALAYAAYQAVPANRANPLLRRLGWFTAGAFACTGLWSVFVPHRQFLLAQAMLLGIWACLAVAFRRLVDQDHRRELGRGERWLVALPLGPFFGWVTAANAVSLHAEAVRWGLVGDAGIAGQALGAALVVLGGVLAAAVVWGGRAGPAEGTVSYAAAVLWALAGIVVNQYDASTTTTVAAVVAAIPVAVAVFGPAIARPALGGGAER